MDHHYNEYNKNEYENVTTNEAEMKYGDYLSGNGDHRGPENGYDGRKKKRGGLKVLSLVLAASLMIGASTAGGVYLGRSFAAKELSVAEGAKVSTEREEASATEKADKVALVTTSDTESTSGVNPADVSSVVENVMPAIVSINNIYNNEGQDFWGNVHLQKDGKTGSGIIIGQNSKELLLVTNNHVTELPRNAKDQKITVSFVDDKTAEAVIKGADRGSDLAVISVNLKDIPGDTLSAIRIATLGDSKKAKVGQMVIAIGNALGYGQSTTVGYISALERSIAHEDYTMKLIQTDAAINQGNSGGALLNAKGEVIGINSAKYAGEKIEGMGFSIPISSAMPIINDLMNREEIAEDEQSYLGIMGQDVTKKHNQVYGMPVGVYIVKVTEGSPASKAGLKMGHIITGFNDYKIKTMPELQEKLASVKAGTEVKITFEQNVNGEYKENSVTVTLGKREATETNRGKKKESEERERPQERRELPEEGEENIFDFFFNQ